MLAHKKEYGLPINKDYVLHWGTAEAIRELIQNAIDSDSSFQWEFSEGSLSIFSDGITLHPSTLLLGTTSKKDNENAIGSFGEGYKIAMLVLTRLGYDVTIYNGEYVWKPVFKHNKTFNSEMLYIIETSCDFKNTGLKFQIDGLSSTDIDLIKEWCLTMNDSIGEIKKVRQGRILLDMPGKLFVGGLYICNTQMHYGYDLNPNQIKLERDRQTVSTFDLQLKTKDMWFDTEDYDLIATLIEKGIPDLEYADWSTPELVKEACYKMFIEKNPDCVLVDSQKELNHAVKSGMTNTVYAGGSYGVVIKSSSSYKRSVVPAEKPLSTDEILEAWFEANRKNMRTKAIVSFKQLLKKLKIGKD